MTSIAPDELRHASLSWQVDAWLQSRLDDEARARVEAARTEAMGQLRSELGKRVDPELTRSAGLPDAEQAKTLLARLQDQLTQSSLSKLAN